MTDPSSPAVSVIIATCNRPGMVQGAIRSALAQPGTDVEVIVVDDCPSDATEQAVAGVEDRRVRYVANPQPSGRGPAIARNLGLSLANAGLVHFLDDDDLVPPGYYASAVAAFAAAPGIAVVFGRVSVFGDDPALLPAEADFFRRAAIMARRRRWLGPKWGFMATMLFGQTLLVCGSAMVRRDCARAVGGFDPAITMFEDVEFYTRAIRAGGGQVLADESLRYRIGPSLARQAKRDEMLADSFRMSHARYCKVHGRLEFLSLKVLERVLRIVKC